MTLTAAAVVALGAGGWVGGSSFIYSAAAVLCCVGKARAPGTPDGRVSTAISIGCAPPGATQQEAVSTVIGIGICCVGGWGRSSV